MTLPETARHGQGWQGYDTSYDTARKGNGLLWLARLSLEVVGTPRPRDTSDGFCTLTNRKN